MSLLTDRFQIEIDNITNNIFPNLNESHKISLQIYIKHIINIIFIKFGFDLTNKDIYYNQFRQNNYRDVKGLLNILLPFIDDDSGKKKKELRSLNDIYIEKDKRSKLDINKSEPIYKYTNLQYGRCYRDNNIATEIEFNIMHIHHNYILLKNTIQLCANRLYVNWLNVTPIADGDYINSNLYRDTYELIVNDNEKIKEWDIMDETDIMYSYSGLPVNTIYDVLVNDFFHNVKNIKWLIYSINDKYNYSYFTMLCEILPANDQLNGVSWSRLSSEKKNIFASSWNKFLVDAFKGNNKNLSFGLVEGTDLQNLMRSIKIFFDKYYPEINKAIDEGYVPIKELKRNIEEVELNPDEDNENGNRIHYITVKDSYNSLLKLNPEYIYDFIRQQFSKYIRTIYAKDNIKFDKTTNLYTYIIPRSDIHDKKLYNYAKSLSHYKENNKYLPYPRYWRLLKQSEKKIILERLNTKKNTDPTSWFNISGYFKRLYKNNLPKSNINLHIELHTIIKYILPEFLIYALYLTGTLSIFKPAPELTNPSQLPTDFEAKNKEIWKRMRNTIFSGDNREKMNKAYYYLTGIPYGQMKQIVYKDKQTDKEKKLDYFDYMTDKNGHGTGQTWHTMYAMDWISQIAFFHKYLNNRVIYVTGATGVGKSTQIPKLLLYAMKALDYNNIGKIIVTQPRIGPTTGNARRIATEMGVPIEMYNEHFDKDIKTNNFNVQYAYRDGKHTSQDSMLNLKISTDGLLVKQLNQNPLLKTTIFNKKNKREPTYGDTNIYDIVVVDEAHEHNKNMDIILSIMKYTAYYNNSVKLVIVSATMDEDEPTYRRFYRDINDNRMYPFNMYNKENNLDRINVDRRLHISPPGEGTRFKVDEYYDKYDINKLKSSSEKLESTINRVMYIINKTSFGDILLFQPGQGDITKAVDQLNQQITQGSIIALPYYGKMDEDKRKFVEDIAKKKYELTIDKSVPFDSVYDIKKVKTVPKGTYKRIIVVATNVAEASITIPSLRYVVDTGNQKVAKFDYRVRDNILDLEYISESSRLQRKGRVGRTAPGTVYYMYPYGTMETNKSAYNISIENITHDLYDLITYDSTNKPYFNNNNNPNIAHNLDINNMTYNNGIDNMIKKQYFAGEQFIKYNGDYNHYDYENNKPPHHYYGDGFSSETLKDNRGTFYIVHPDELSFGRNILGNISKIYNKNVILKGNKVISKKINTFFDILQEELLLVPIDNNNYFKTEYGKKLYEILADLKIDDIRDLISFIFSFQYGADNSMAMLLPMYWTSKTFSDWWESYQDSNGRYLIRVDVGKAYVGKNGNDSVSFLKIGNMIIKFFERHILHHAFNTKLIITSSMKKTINEQKQKYIKYVQTGKLDDINKDKDSDAFEFLKNIDNKNKLSYSSETSQKELDEFIKLDYGPKYYSDILKTNEKNLKEFCDKTHLNYKTVVKFIKKYIKFVNTVYKHINNLYDDDSNPSKLDRSFKWFDNRLRKFKNINSDMGINITKSFLHGYGNNITINLDGTSFYVPIRNPSPEYALEINKIGRSNILDTSVSTIKLTEYVLYLHKKPNTHFITCLHTITPTMIQNHTINIANPNKINDMKKIYMGGDTTIPTLFKMFRQGDERQSLIKYDIVNKFSKTIQRIYIDMLNNYDDTFLIKLQELESDDNKQKKQKYLNLLTILRK